MNNTSYGGLDRFRMFAAFLVIGIHTSPLLSYSADGDFFLTRILGRVAVPFFFMVTGQFVLGGIGKDKDGGRERILAYVKKTALLYGAAIILYMPLGIYAGHYQGIGIPRVFRMLAFDGTFYHLWYFPASIIGVLVVYLMGRFLDSRGMGIAAGLLYVAGLLGDSYFGAARQVPALEAVYEAGFRVFSYTRNGLFLAPIFLVLGMGAGTGRSFGRGVAAPIGLGVSFLVMVGEAFTLRNLGFQRHGSMYIALVFVMAFLYQLLLAWKKKPAKILRAVSAWIYILHPAMIVAVRGGAEFLGLEDMLVENSLAHYLAVAVLSFLAAFGVSMGREALRPGRGSRGRRPGR